MNVPKVDGPKSRRPKSGRSQKLTVPKVPGLVHWPNIKLAECLGESEWSLPAVLPATFERNHLQVATVCRFVVTVNSPLKMLRNKIRWNCPSVPGYQRLKYHEGVDLEII